MSETKAMRYGDTEMTIEHNGKTVVTNIKEMQEVTDRLSGTDYVKTTLTKASAEWLETAPRLGDEMTLTVFVQCVEIGKRLTEDGIQATAKLEIVGIREAD